MARNFARTAPRKSTGFEDKLSRLHPDRDKVTVQSEYSDATIMEPDSDEVTKEFLSHMYLKPQSMPQLYFFSPTGFSILISLSELCRKSEK